MTDNKKDDKKQIGYNGYFPKSSVVKFHNESYGMNTGIASINVHIKDGEYNGFDISVNKETVRYE